MRLYEFAPSPGYGDDDNSNEGSWDDFFAVVMPEMKKMGFATSKDPLHNRGPEGTLLFKVMKPPLDWRAVMFKLYDEDPTQAYWKIVDGTGGETKLLEHGLADLNTQGAAFMLAKIENVLGLDESLNEFAPGNGSIKPPKVPRTPKDDPWGNDDRSKLLQTVKQLLLAGNKIDWKVVGQMGHVVRVTPDSVILKRWGKPYSKINYSLMLDDTDDDNYIIRPVGPKHYKVVSADPEWQLEEEQLDELSFRGSQCTKDCSGHRAGYEWSNRKGGADAASWSPSFNKGAWLHNNGF